MTTSNEKRQFVNEYEEIFHTLGHYQGNVVLPCTATLHAVYDDLRKIVEIVKKYHRDDSDISIDYFNCNFYFHLNLGRWDNPFVDGITTAPGISAPLVAVEA